MYRRIGMSPRWIRHGPKRLAHRALMRRAARVVAVAEAVRSETIDLFGVAARNVVTIPNAIDPERLEPSVGREAMRRSLGIGPSAPVVLSVGALTWEKDPLTHVEVGRRVLARLRDAVHVFVGDGPLREEAERRAAGSGVGERMTVLGKSKRHRRPPRGRRRPADGESSRRDGRHAGDRHRGGPGRASRRCVRGRRALGGRRGRNDRAARPAREISRDSPIAWRRSSSMHRRAHAWGRKPGRDVGCTSTSPPSPRDTCVCTRTSPGRSDPPRPDLEVPP